MCNNKLAAYKYMYVPTPVAIFLADSCYSIQQIKIIITDVLCHRQCRGSIVADHTIGDRYADPKFDILPALTCTVHMCRGKD